jgi:endonuclease YncB( thermonuclease family)
MGLCDTIAGVLISGCAAALPGIAAAQERPAASDGAGCVLEAVGAGTVRTVRDGRTLVLSDGRQVRLAGIEAPGSEPGAGASRAALQLKRLGDGTDRHGRLLVHVFTAGDERWAQQALLAAGHARVGSRVGDAACAARLLNAERAARAAGVGLWSQPRYAVRRADDVAALLAERGRFTLIEGQVVSVRDSGGTIYVNFSRRWSDDFTVTVPRRYERGFAAAGRDLRQLAGRAVRVRGVIEERGGPWIEVTRPEQIEVIGRD